MVWRLNETHILHRRLVRGRRFFMIVTFVGHSSYVEKESDKQKIMEILERNVGDTDCDFFLGGYGNFDKFSLNCCIEYRKKHKKSKLIYVIPYLDRKYDLTNFDGSVYPPIENVPKRFAISRRNKWVVEQADIIIAFVRYLGGAKTTLDYAIKKSKLIYNLAVIN